MRLELEDLGVDEFGPFAQVLVVLGNKERVVRWGLDNYTYWSFHTCLTKIWGNNEASATKLGTYKLQLSPEYKWHSRYHQFVSNVVYAEGITPVQKVLFLCSNLYVANLKWLQGISDIDALGDNTLPEGMTVESTASHAMLKPFVRKRFTGNSLFTTKRVTSGIAIIVVCIAGTLYGIHISIGSKGTSKLSESQTTGAGPTQDLKSGQGTSSSLTDNESSPGKSTSRTTRTNPSAKPSNLSASGSKDTRTGGTEPERVPVVWHVPKGTVALTFSGGPSLYTRQIVNILKQYHVHATFFFVGDRANYWRNSVIEAAISGDAIGDASMTRPLMPTLSKAQQQYQIAHTSQILETIIHKPISLFQPPYEAYDNTTRSVVSQMGMTLALWNQDPRDWQASSPAEIVRHIEDTDASGSIYTLNELPDTVKALPSIIFDLQQQNLKFVTLP